VLMLCTHFSSLQILYIN